MACFDGMRGGATQIIRPRGLVGESLEAAPREKLLLAEVMFSKGPLSAASYPVLALRLASCNVGVLKAALGAALAAHPMLAGRLHHGEVALTNEGVPFTVVEDPGDRAPEEIEERLLLRMANFRNPRRVRQGLEPLLTVKVTRYVDGSAVLAVCRSHALLDGTSAWAFLADWAAAARGQPLEDSTPATRAALRGLLPSDEQVDELSRELRGKVLTRGWKGWAMDRILAPVCAVWDGLFLSGAAFPSRPRLFLTDAEVSRIKAAATPAPGTGDGWVSTQEAVAAYLLLTVCRALLPADSRGRALLVLLLDVRRALGLPESACAGCGIALLGLKVPGILQKGLAEVTGEIHEAAKEGASPEVVRTEWLLLAGMGERGFTFDVMDDLMQMRMDSDITLQLNNQSKRRFPDFGEGSGGPAEAAMTNAGPTLIFPARGGVQVLLCPSFVGRGRRAARALEALRNQVPGAPAGPTLVAGGRRPELLGGSKPLQPEPQKGPTPCNRVPEASAGR